MRVAVLTLTVFSACEGLVGDPGPADSGSVQRDAGAPGDAGANVDAGTVNDAGDSIDAGAPQDAGQDFDAGSSADAGPIDAGGPDAGGSPDAGAPVDAGPATPVTFHFTAIPLTDPDLVAPFRGGESWHDQSPAVDVPTEGAGQKPLDVFHRSWFTWAMLESAQGTYTFDANMAPYINTAIDNGQRFSFEIMTIFPDDTTNTSPQASGVGMSYPLYVHNLMQAETVTDWNAPEYWNGINGGVQGHWWVPNYNSPAFQTRWNALLSALAMWLKTHSYHGVTYDKVIGYVVIGGLGTWAEGHHHPFLVDTSQGEGRAGAWPAGHTPTWQSLNAMIDAYVTNFPDDQLVAEMAWFDAHGYGNTWNPPETAEHVFSVSNNRGKIGWRRDNWNTTYYAYVLEMNDRFTVNGVPGNEVIMNRWKEAPVGGEVYCDGSDMADLKNEVLQYGASTVGNGNYCLSSLPTSLKNNYRAAMKVAGYRLVLTDGSLSRNTLVNQAPFSISLTWQNVGNAPVYEPWDVVFQLRDGANAVAWEGTSSKALRLFLPAPTGSVTTDTFTFSGVPAGTYSLVLVVKDRRGYRQPLPLAITGRQAQGQYVLATGVTVR